MEIMNENDLHFANQLNTNFTTTMKSKTSKRKIVNSNHEKRILQQLNRLQTMHRLILQPDLSDSSDDEDFINDVESPIYDLPNPSCMCYERRLLQILNQTRDSYDSLSLSNFHNLPQKELAY